MNAPVFNTWKLPIRLLMITIIKKKCELQKAFSIFGESIFNEIQLEIKFAKPRNDNRFNTPKIMPNFSQQSYHYFVVRFTLVPAQAMLASLKVDGS